MVANAEKGQSNRITIRSMNEWSFRINVSCAMSCVERRASGTPVTHRTAHPKRVPLACRQTVNAQDRILRLFSPHSRSFA
jgi:hypothetical protein